MLALRRIGCCSATRIILQQHCMNITVQQQQQQQQFGLKSLCTPENLPKYIKGFNDIPELETANEMVQKIFSLEMASHKEFRRISAEIYTDQFETKLEKNIANATQHIRILTEQLMKFKKDRQAKEFLIWLIDQRKKNLKKLKAEDIEKYNFLIKTFEIPPLQSAHEPQNKYKFRKYKINVPLKKKRSVDEFEDAQVY